MTTTPPEEPQGSGTPPTPPPPSGYEAAPPAYQAPAGGYQAPPPGYQAPPPGYQAPAPAYGAAPTGAPLSDSEQRQWATIGHAGAIVIGFVAPLVVWLIYKGRGQFVEEQAKESLNFQILVAIGAFVSSILVGIGIGLVTLPLVLLANLIFCILAAVATNKGEAYRYPLNWRIIK